MATAKDTRCGRFSHAWDSGLCTVCFEEHPAARRSRIWNAMMRRIVEAGADVYAVPPPPGYSTRDAIQDRALEAGTRHHWYLELVRIGRQDGRPYRAFRRAVERAGGTLALPFPTPTTIRVTNTAPRAPRVRCARKAVAA